MSRGRRSSILVSIAGSCLWVSSGGGGPVPDYVHDGPGFELPANPLIQAWMAEVDADSLFSYVDRLTQFGTRSTVSDTVSTTTGIGAARNWVHDRFAESNNPSASAGFFDWTANMCGSSIDARNVLFQIDGTITPHRRFIAIAHLDSRTVDVCSPTADAPGANDDGSGVAALLELARILADEPLESTLELIASSGEEQGLFGAIRQASQAVKDGTRIDGVLNNDIIGNIEGCKDPACPGGGGPDMIDSLSVRCFSRGPDTTNGRQLTRAEKLQQLRYMPDHTIHLIPLQDRPGRGGDHLPYATRGFAASRFTEAFEFGDGSGNGHQHNGLDLIEFMNFPYLQRNVRLNVACLANFLLAPESPAPPTIVDVGQGTLELSWPSVTTAPDVAGYRAAFRLPDELFYFDVRSAGFDVGAVQTESFVGLPVFESYYVSISTYDTDFNESIFCLEQLVESTVAVDGPAALPDVVSFHEAGSMGAETTSFRLGLPRAGRVDVSVYDVTGRLVREVLDAAWLPAGTSIVYWDGRDRTGRPTRPGVYLARLSVGGEEAVTVKTVRVD